VEFIQRRIRASSSRAETKVVAMGCIHHGAAGCDERLADFWYNYILKTPDTYVILGGDLVDSIHEKDKRYLDEEVATWCFGKKWGGTVIDRQYNYALAKWRPLAEAGKILWIHAGNHEWKLKTTASRDLTLDWSRALSEYARAKGHDPVPYAGLSALSNLIVDSGDARKKNHGSFLVKFFTTHGGGGAQSTGSVINKADSMLNSYKVDVALMWHLHRKQHVEQPLLGITDSGKRTVASRIAAVCGTFLDGNIEGVTGYGELKQYRPSSLGPQVIHLKSKTLPKDSEEKHARSYIHIWLSDAIEHHGSEEETK
jgi:hypothetical protein